MSHKVLITGGAGFIGSHIADFFLDQGCQVIIVDNFKTGSYDHIAADAVVYECDIRSDEFRNIVAGEKPDCIIHHAAQVDVSTSLQDPVHDADVNVLGTINVLEASRLNNVRKVIYASSAAVYGDPQYLPVDENHPILATSPYGVSKYTVERYLYMYRHVYGLEYTVLRYANVYGPRQAVSGEGGVVAIFMNKALSADQCTVFGSGEQTRDFVYVRDIARANFLALHKGDGMTINLGSETETSVNELLSLVSEVTGRTIKAIHADERPGEIIRSVLSNQKARDTLDWTPKFDLRQGLKALAHEGTLVVDKLA